MLLIYGYYRLARRKLAFRNDLCLNCMTPRRVVQIRSFILGHLYWIPILPLGLRREWFCCECGKDPAVRTRTRCGIKWAGLVLLVLFSLMVWVIPFTLPPEKIQDPWVVWAFRIGMPLAAFFTYRHLRSTTADPTIDDLRAQVVPASDDSCPFCGVALESVPEWHCPSCGIERVK